MTKCQTLLTLKTFSMGFNICNLTLSHFLGRTSKKTTLLVQFEGVNELELKIMLGSDLPH